MLKNKTCDIEHVSNKLKFVSQEARDFVMLLLTKNPNKRPSAIQALGHPWFFEEKNPLKNSLNLNKFLTDAKNNVFFNTLG